MKILVIRLKHIGDALLCLPVCESLRRTFPQAQIDYLLYEHIAPLFEKHPAINNVVQISNKERRSVWRYFAKILKLRRRRYDLVIDLMTSPISAFITYCAGGQSIGFEKGKWRSRLYGTRVPHDRSLGWLGSKLAILSGLPQTVVLDRTIRIGLSEEEITSMQTQMRAAGIDTTEPVVMFSPISRMGLKNWPAEYFVDLIQQVVTRHNVQVVLIWGPGEQEGVRAIAERSQLPGKVVIGLETRDLRALAALAVNCVLFVGNDSGPRHVAEAAGAATFTIFPPDVRKTIWSPLLDNRHRALDMTDVLGIDETQWLARASSFRRDYEHHYRQITPEFVYQKLAPMLEEVLEAPFKDHGPGGYH